ncbi:hypothetical protein GCM10018773_20220 [Streptomyces candidus]|nr:hypothetical protein GCM10018773_20220 [Streptomyces candidus]
MASCPSPASATTSMSGCAASTIRNPVRSSIWSSTSMTRIEFGMEGDLPGSGRGGFGDAGRVERGAQQAWGGFACGRGGPAVSGPV